VNRGRTFSGSAEAVLPFALVVSSVPLARAIAGTVDSRTIPTTGPAATPLSEIITSGLRNIVLAATLFLALVALMPLAVSPLTDSTALLLASIGLAALAEEFVFRRALPLRASGGLQKLGIADAYAKFIAIVCAQLMFAFAHSQLLGAERGPIDQRELARLFAAGILYTLVARNAGIAFAAAIHARLNLEAISQYGQIVPFSTLYAPLLGAAGAFMVFLDCRYESAAGKRQQDANILSRRRDNE